MGLWEDGVRRNVTIFNSGEDSFDKLITYPRAGIPGIPSPAKDFGWHDPGYIHSAVMTGLQPSQFYNYRYGR